MNILLDSSLAKKQARGGTQKSHDFTIHFTENIILDKNKSYQAALNELITMSYSWYNIRDVYNNNKLSWKKKTDKDWKEIFFPDGMYDYSTINKFLQGHIGQNIINIYFDSTIYRTVIILHEDFEINMNEGNFSDLLGFGKEILQDKNNVSERVPNITRGVDWVYIHCDLISNQVDNIGSDVLFALSTADLAVSYPFSKEPMRLLWHGVNKNQISSIRIYITDGRNNELDMNDLDVALSLMIKESE